MNKRERLQYEAILRFAKKQGIDRPFWNTTLFGVKMELKALGRYIHKGEKIYCLVPCRFKNRKSLAVVTNRRVMILNRGLLGNLSATEREDVYYSMSAGGNPSGLGIHRYSISVPGNGNDIEITGLWLGDLKRFDQAYNYGRQEYEVNKGRPDSSPFWNQPDQIKREAQIERLKGFLLNGTITEEEYNTLLKEI